MKSYALSELELKAYMNEKTKNKKIEANLVRAAAKGNSMIITIYISNGYKTLKIHRLHISTSFEI